MPYFLYDCNKYKCIVAKWICRIEAFRFYWEAFDFHRYILRALLQWISNICVRLKSVAKHELQPATKKISDIELITKFIEISKFIQQLYK